MTLTVHGAGLTLTAHRYLAISHARQATSIARLSSGLRINSAADDSAGLSIAAGMRAQIGGIRVGQRNAQDAISMVQLSDGALASTHDILHRLRDLTVRAANTGSLNPAALAAIQTEATQLREGLDHLATSTAFNGHQLLGGNFIANFQVGPGARDSIEVSFSTDASAAGLGLDTLAFAGQMTSLTTVAGKAHFGGRPGSASTFHLDLPDDGAVTRFVAALSDPATDFTVGGVAVDVSSVTTLDDLTDAITSSGKVTVTRDESGITLTALTFGPEAVTVTGASGTHTAGAATVPDAGGNEATLTANVDFNQLGGQITLTGAGTFNLASAAAAVAAAPDTASKAAALAAAAQAAFTDASVSVDRDGKLTVTANSAAAQEFTTHTTAASAALEAIDAAISTVSSARGHLGATQNRLTHTISAQGAALENLTAAHSRITDADMGTELMNLTRARIASDVGAALISQAQVGHRSALALLLPNPAR